MRHVRSAAVFSGVVMGLLLPSVAFAADPPYGNASNDSVAPCAAGLTDSPCSDPFFTPPSGLAALADGTVIGQRPVTIAQPGPVAKAAYTITYRSEDSFGAPVMGSATVLVPLGPYTGTGTTPLVALQVAEDSLGRQCAPSYSLAHQGVNAIVQSETPSAQSLLDFGYVVVIPDAEGAAEQFIAGRQEGHAVLDALRATKTLTPETGLTAATRVAMMGYSGGANSTGWAAELAGSYAPDLDVGGAIEGGTPADLTETAKYNEGSATQGAILLSLVSLDRAYPGAGTHAALSAQGLSDYNTISTECAQAILNYPGRTLDSYTTTPDLIDTPTYQALLANIKLGQSAPGFPIFNYHVLNDELVPYPQDKRLVDYYCAQGVAVTHLELAGDHVSGEVEGEPVAVAWLAGRFNGTPVTNTCAVTNAEPVPPLLPTVVVPSIGTTTPTTPTASGSPTASPAPAAGGTTNAVAANAASGTSHSVAVTAAASTPRRIASTATTATTASALAATGEAQGIAVTALLAIGAGTMGRRRHSRPGS